MARRAPSEHGGAPCQRQSENVAEIVAGISEQRQRPGQQTGRRFRRDIRHIEADPNRERPVEIGAPIAMGMPMRVPVGMGAGLSWLMRVLMIGVRVGLRHAAASATAGGWFLPIDRIWCATAPRHREYRMKALVTGFEPFGDEPINPALEALPCLPGRLGRIEIATWRLPTAFGRSLDALDAALAATHPDLVLCIGLAGGRAALSLERVAINLDDARIPDNSGQQPIDRAIVPGGPAAYFASLPIKAAVAALRRAGLPAIVSNTAGTFVCNHVFYGLMHRATTTRPAPRGGFLHVPYLPAQAARGADSGWEAPSMALADIVRGIEIVLAVAATHTEDIKTSEGAIS